MPSGITYCQPSSPGQKLWLMTETVGFPVVSLIHLLQGIHCNQRHLTRYWVVSATVYRQHFLMSFEGSCFSILFWNADIALDIQGLPLLVHVLFLDDPSLILLQLSPMKTTPIPVPPGLISLPGATHAPSPTKPNSSSLQPNPFFLVFISP